ncbi:MAG: hypothetical protein F6K36_29485 [Symploca sp. SIO3C6]|nr:hypothetical protein [Symploca sp. SIO3C6]
MPRGGYRPGAGGKPTWKHGKTKVIRVPETLAAKILEIAKILDNGVSFVEVTESKSEPVTASKVIDLSRISIRAFKEGPGIYLADLIAAGYEIRPEKLARSVKVRASQEKQKRVQSLKSELDAAIEELNFLGN